MKNIKLIVSVLMLLGMYGCSTAKVSDKNTTKMNNKVESEKEDTQNKAEEKAIDFNSVAVVMFDFDKSNLNSEEKAKVKQQARSLKNNKFMITVEGHTDYLGTREYNLALGERRANTTKSMLVKNGIESSRIKVVSYGKDKPVDSDLTDSAREKNRRTITIVEE